MGAIAYPFHIPDELNATKPKEFTSGSRDDVKLLVLDPASGGTIHDRFNRLEEFLLPGDLVVFNNSRTIPAVLKAKQSGREIEVRLSRRIDENQWEALMLGEFIQTGHTLQFSERLTASITGSGSEAPLCKLRFSISGTALMDEIYRIGEPIRYEYIDEEWSLDSYQTVYASVPGSVEMPSAGRAFTWEGLNRLKAKGINTAFLQLHTGLSYYENDRWPNPKHHPETYRIPEETAALVNRTRESGGRVIAIGTTVVRALESAVDLNGRIRPEEGTTTLYIDKSHPLRAVDGLLTGFHEPEASHLDMLTSFIDTAPLMKAYKEAIHKGYHWHEFGDMNLILPNRCKP
ncbi:S-adenosylmethionine:tRNA ribosyltransferase-isomerase [Thalassobacillus hwangdonensis]|uniref:S-adenosylmethionine:tRNA ribosyltransferase-isomerase n=1 Tax=Thalassobacillus hwangdonensis TaxID=546108 RepID=A0ABW3L2E0_9BACI